MAEASFILFFGRAEPFQCAASEQGDADGAKEQIGHHLQAVDEFQSHCISRVFDRRGNRIEPFPWRYASICC